MGNHEAYGIRTLAVPGQGLFEESETPNNRVGDVLSLGDRTFVYAKNGAVALTRGKMCQSAAPVANHINKACSAAVAVGGTVISPTIGATAVTINYYKDGFLYINDVDGEGQIFRVKSHPASAGSAALAVTVWDEVVTALTTNSEASLICNPFANLIVAPLGGLSAPARGVPLINVTIGYYFWLQTRGPCAVLTQGTVVIGQKVGLGGTADGACGPVAADVTDIWGRVMSVNASTEYSLIDLKL